MKFHHIIIVLISLCFMACESFFIQPATKKEEEILDENILALNAIFNTHDDTLVARVYRVASPLTINFWDYESEYEVLKEAKLYLSDGVNTKEMQYHEETNGFILPQTAFPLAEGASYTLEAVLGNEQVKANTTVPHFDINPMVVFTKEEQAIHAAIEWTDPAAETNYYSMYGTGMTATGEYLRNDLINNEIDFTCGMMSDSRRNGKKFEHLMRFQSWYGNPLDPETASVWVTIFHLSEDYYLYQEDLCYNYGDSPFAEPSPIHSNVEGGVGIFAINAVRVFSNQ